MKKTFTINNFDKHLIIEDNGKTYLIDTGSPFSIHDGMLEFCGLQFPRSMAPCSPEDISNLLGMHVDALVGFNVLRHFAVLIDYSKGEITFCDEGLSLPDAVAIPINTGFGVPKVKMSLLGHEGLFFLDTGAKISYVASETTNGLTPDETDSDFYPGFGDFETPVFNLETTIAGKSFRVRYGNLPLLLEQSLMGLSGTKGVVGYDFFNSFKVLIDYRNNQLFLTENGKVRHEGTSQQADLLNELTPETIAHGVFPVKDLLYNSVYYPASEFDGGIIRDCNVNRKDWNVLSFVYVDYDVTEKRLSETDMPRGYRLLGERRLTEAELVPNGWTPQLPPNFDMEHYLHAVGRFANKHPFATWMVFERLPEFNENHGPKRFSLLYLCADGVAAYQALYWTHRIHPRAVAIIQPGTGFGFNWTDFFMASDPFYWTVSHNPAGRPDYVYCGYWSHSATSNAANPENMRLHFNWPDYQFMEPAVGYPGHEVVIFWKKPVGAEKPIR